MRDGGTKENHSLQLWPAAHAIDITLERTPLSASDQDAGEKVSILEEIGTSDLEQEVQNRKRRGCEP